MNPEQLGIAIANTKDPAAKAMLASLESAFQKVYDLNQSFVDRINANKAARGESQTKLSKRKREELSQYGQDELEGERRLTASYAKLEGASIISAMSYALETDLKFWGGAMLKHSHVADRPLIQEVYEAKMLLQSKLRQFLEHFPAPKGDESEHDS